jgi:hypothetical protein
MSESLANMLRSLEGGPLGEGVDGLVEGIQDPYQDQLARGPHAVTFLDLLDAGWILVVDVVRAGQRLEHQVQQLKERAFYLTPLIRVTLYHRDKVVNAHVVCGDSALCLVGYWNVGGLW